MCLAPVNFRRKITRLVSYYALFKWWLLLSQHPSCLCNFTSFSTQHIFRDLNRWSGLFPFRPWILLLTVWLPDILINGIRSLSEISSSRRVLHSNSRSTSMIIHPRLALRLFRREPAISKFVWNFTATHISSKQFSTYIGSDLRSVLPNFHPEHG